MHDKDWLPESPIAGLVPTMNNTGWMTESLDEISTAFTDFAGGRDDESLDMGCAYGIATLAALDKGARVFACDIEPQHLDILARRVPAAVRDRFRSRPGALPDVDFDAGSFGAILAARVLHFLAGDAVEQTVAKMHDWLKPGGNLFLVVDSPYTGPWKDQADVYERRKAAGEPWPGYVADYARYLPTTADPAEHPTFINPMDPDILRRVCEQAGLEVLEARFVAGSTRRRSDRDHAGVVARRRDG